MQLMVTINYHVFPWFNFGTVPYLFGTDWSSANVTFTATIWKAKTLIFNFLYSTRQLIVTINYHVFPWFNFGTVTYLFGTDWSSANVTFTATIWKASKRSTVHQDDWSLLFVWKQNLSNEIKKNKRRRHQ